MATKQVVLAALVGLGVAAWAIGDKAPAIIHPAYAACDPGTHIDGTTAESTRRLLQKAGYHDIKIDQKGCDNVWHVIATKDGERGRFAVVPGGKIYPEGD